MITVGENNDHGHMGILMPVRGYNKKSLQIFSYILYDLFCNILKEFSPISKIPIVKIIFVTTNQILYHMNIIIN